MQSGETGMRGTIALLLLLAACGMKEPENERVRKTVASWDALLALAASSYARGELPKHFVKNATEAATEELSKQANGHAAARAIALAHDLQEAAEHDDISAATRVGNELDKEAKELQ